jgi:hypothetical protein
MQLAHLWVEPHLPGVETREAVTAWLGGFTVGWLIAGAFLFGRLSVLAGYVVGGSMAMGRMAKKAKGR